MIKWHHKSGKKITGSTIKPWNNIQPLKLIKQMNRFNVNLYVYINGTMNEFNCLIPKRFNFMFKSSHFSFYINHFMDSINQQFEINLNPWKTKSSNPKPYKIKSNPNPTLKPIQPNPKYYVFP